MTQQLQVDPIQIFYPLGGTQSVQVYIWDGSKPVLWDGSVTFSGSLPSTVAGNLTNDNAPPSTDNLGVLPAIANAVAPSWTEGNQVLLSVDLSGALRVSATIDTTGLATSANQVSQIALEIAMAASLSVLDDWDETNRAAVNTIAGQVGVQGGAGTVTALTQRIAIATDANAITIAAGSAVIGHVITDSGSVTSAVITAGSAQIGHLEANQSVNVAQLNGHTTLEGGTNGSLAIGGTVATNVAITANPINLGAQAVSSENSAATTARQVQLVADLVGKLIVLPYANPENFVSGAITSAMTGTTSTSLIASPGGSLRNYITQVTVSNSHATVGTDMILQDGSGGTTLYTIPAAAVYGGATLSFPVPLRQPTTATALFIQNVTTGASTKASASGYKGL